MRAAATLLLGAAVGAHAGAFGNKHALVIGIDGLGANIWSQVSIPNIKGLSAGNAATTLTAYAGGVVGTATEQSTLSGPGWYSVLTGVWANKHNIDNNADVSVTPKKANPAYPTMCAALHNANANAFCSCIATWSQFTDHIMSDADYKNNNNDETNTVRAVEHLTNGNPDVLFLALDDVDHVGHGHGSGSAEYLAKVEFVDTQVGRVLDAMKGRSTYASEDWMVLLVSDHGHRLSGGHGSQSTQERTIPMIHHSSQAQKGTVAQGPGQVAALPTVLQFLGVAIPAGLDGSPFGFAGGSNPSPPAPTPPAGGGATCTDYAGAACSGNACLATNGVCYSSAPFNDQHTCSVTYGYTWCA